MNETDDKNAIIATVDSVRTRAATRGTLITFEVPDEHSAQAAVFITKIGHQVALAFADVESGFLKKPKQPKSPKHPYGEAAKALKLSGFFRRPEVWRELGTDEEFREWIRQQPSAWSGDFDRDPNQERPPACEAAHVSRIEYGRGAGHKPEYACIPLTHKEHMLHHAQGESVFDQELLDGSIERGRQWMERQRIKYVEAWAWETLREKFGGESMGDIPPSVVRGWAEVVQLDKYLPDSYR